MYSNLWKVKDKPEDSDDIFISFIIITTHNHLTLKSKKQKNKHTKWPKGLNSFVFFLIY
jgi:hypothetical protein